MNSPPPDHEKEFQVIKLFLEKSLNQRVSIKSFHDEDEGGKVGHSLEEAENLFDYVKLQSLLSIPLCIQQSNLSNFFGLKERMVAAESCHFVAQVLLEIKPLVPFISAEVGPKFDTVVDDYVYAAEQLRSLIYKFMSPSLINQNLNILSQIVEAAWDSRKPPERQHEWVDRLVANCKKVWDFVSTGKEFSEMIQEQIWLECCQASFDVTIEGFSKVRKCTAEGRAAMTLDLFALHEGLNKIHLCRPPRGKPYVDNYLRTFYLSEEEIMNWIQQNWQAYAYRHLHGLLQQTMSSMLNSKKLRDAIATVDSLYDVESTAISTMFTSRFKDENKFSNLITSKFRR